MTKKFLNKLRMMKAVLALLMSNLSVWEMIPDVVNDVDELKLTVDEIEATQMLTSTELTGQSDEKETVQAKLIRMILSISSALMARADRTSHEVLAAKVNFSESALRSQRDQEQVVTGRRIAKLAEENLEGLTSSGITIDQVTALRELTDQFEALLPVNRISVAERKAANARLKTLFKQADKLLKNRLDRMMVRYETEDPAFYAAYENARMILDYGTRYEKEEQEEMPEMPD
jgi:hypothetical protein